MPDESEVGILAGNSGWFKMTDVEVPEEDMPGRRSEGFKIAMFALDQGRYTVASGATGLIRAASERAVSDCVQIHGANGYSGEYPAGRFFRNCKGAVIYEGTREIHKLMQADYLLGYRADRPTRCDLPAYAAHIL